jgi:hypothetical protein
VVSPGPSSAVTWRTRGAESRFESERAAAVQDLRRDAYGTYVGTAQEVWATYLASAPQEEIDTALVRLIVAQARVRLVAKNDEVEDAAKRLRVILVDGEGEDYEESEFGELREDLEKATTDFLAVAQEDIEG